jgi:Na+/proline symporter
MEKTTVVIATLLAYKLLLIGVGFWAKSRNRDAEDFFLGGRGLGPVVAAISYSSSASSAWTLLGVSGIAYVIGISAVWIAAGSFSGMLVAWFWIGPRLMRFSRRHRQITVTDFLAHDSAGAMRRAIVIVTSAIVIFSFTFYVAAQFQGAGNTFASTFDLSMNEAILIGALIIMIYTMLGGFWAVSVTDTIQGLLMAVTAILMPIVAVAGAGGFGGFLDGLRAVSTPGQLSWNGGSAGLVAAGFIVGALSIGFGTYGQPHLLVRFMALRDEQALRRARVITIVWYAVVFLSMLFLAIMSTADSQLLVAASAIDHDLGLGRGRPERSLLISRLTIAFLVLFAVVVAIWLPERIFSRVLFAWIALGSAFGPTVFLRLGGVRLRPGGVLLSIVTGFGLAVLFYLMPDTPGDVLERLVPFCAALAALVLFGHRGPAQPGARRSSAPDTGT